MGNTEDGRGGTMTDYFGYVCFIIGFLAGLALWYYHDLKDNPYLRGFQDGYDWANIPEKEEKKVDAVPVIRCKDCKYSLHNQFTGDWYCWLYNIAREVESDGFCYKAERKEE